MSQWVDIRMNSEGGGSDDNKQEVRTRRFVPGDWLSTTIATLGGWEDNWNGRRGGMLDLLIKWHHLASSGSGTTEVWNVRWRLVFSLVVWQYLLLVVETAPCTIAIGR